MQQEVPITTKVVFLPQINCWKQSEQDYGTFYQKKKKKGLGLDYSKTSMS